MRRKKSLGEILSEGLEIGEALSFAPPGAEKEGGEKEALSAASQETGKGRAGEETLFSAPQETGEESGAEETLFAAPQAAVEESGAEETLFAAPQGAMEENGAEETLFSAPQEEAQTGTAAEGRQSKDELEIEKQAHRYQVGDGVEKDLQKALFWYGKSASSLARFAAATIYEELGDFVQMETELLRGLEAEDDMALAFLHMKLGELYLKGKGREEEPDYTLAIRHLEKCLSIEPTAGSSCAGFLGAAYEGLGKRIPAIHWYRAAVEEFGREDYRNTLNRLYLTGAAGAAKKRQAEAALREKEEGK